MRGRVIRFEGQLVVCVWDTDWHEPFRRDLYWPLSEDRSVQPARLENRVVVETGRGAFGVAPEDPDFWTLRHCVAALRNGDKTESIHVEQTPIPPPKTRSETRWRQGRWEKRLKKGWVEA